MSAGDDDHDDDAQLKQLRAVWVSMRDEDPPERGLASLMAAAREKAAELEAAASPSWWQRVVALLRRPPVLALATVTVLLGGALIVAQRGSQMKADATATSETADRYRGDSRSMDDTAHEGGAVAPGPGGDSKLGASPASAGSAATVDRGIDQEIEQEIEKPRPRDPKPAAKAKTTATVTPSPDPPPVLNKESLPPEPGARAEAGPRGAGGGAPPALSIAQDDVPVEADAAPRDEAATVKAKPRKPIARTAPPAIEGEDRRTSKDSLAPQPTVEQLVKQCETAAARGDCAAVRVIAQKILTSSPAAYKTRVANNAAIHRCLPSPAANAAAE